MEKVATDIYTFSELRRGGFAYVDTTGYLTISGFRNIGGSRLYSLDFPNREVRESFLHDVAPVYSGLREDVAGSAFSSERRTIVEELVEELPPQLN